MYINFIVGSLQTPIMTRKRTIKNWHLVEKGFSLIHKNTLRICTAQKPMDDFRQISYLQRDIRSTEIDHLQLQTNNNTNNNNNNNSAKFRVNV